MRELNCISQWTSRATAPVEPVICNRIKQDLSRPRVHWQLTGAGLTRTVDYDSWGRTTTTTTTLFIAYRTEIDADGRADVSMTIVCVSFVDLFD